MTEEGKVEGLFGITKRSSLKMSLPSPKTLCVKTEKTEK